MKTFELNGTVRTDLGKKSSKKIRQNDQVPCNMYGGKGNISFTVSNPDIRKLIYTPHVYIVDLSLGSQKHKAIIHEVQTHPVTDHIIHLDFLEVFDDKPMVIDVPVIIKGSAIGVRKGGRMQVFKRYLKMKALPKFIPDDISIDVTDIEIENSIKVSDIKLSNATFIERLTDQIVGVYYARTVVEETPVAGVADAAVAGAVPAAGAVPGAPAAGAPAAPGAAPAAGAAAPAAAPKKK